MAISDDMQRFNSHVLFSKTLQGLPGGAMSAKGDLRTSTKSLQSCSLTPGLYSLYLSLFNHAWGSERERSPLTTVAPGSIPGLSVICELSLLLILSLASRVFLQVLRFSFPPKINISKFQFDLGQGPQV
jgi:hypothetical protein